MRDGPAAVRESAIATMRDAARRQAVRSDDGGAVTLALVGTLRAPR